MTEHEATDYQPLNSAEEVQLAIVQGRYVECLDADDGRWHRVSGAHGAAYFQGSITYGDKYRASHAAPLPTPEANRHEWDRDGERCVKCGDKDWMASPTCNAPTPEAERRELPPLPNASYAGIFTPEQMYAYAREAIALSLPAAQDGEGTCKQSLQVAGKEVVACHAIVSDECRTNRSSPGAVSEAIRRVWDAANDLSRAWPIGKGAKLHIRLSVEYPEVTPTPNAIRGDKGAIPEGEHYLRAGPFSIGISSKGGKWSVVVSRGRKIEAIVDEAAPARGDKGAEAVAWLIVSQTGQQRTLTERYPFQVPSGCEANGTVTELLPGRVWRSGVVEGDVTLVSDPRLTDCGHSPYDPCHNCESAPTQAAAKGTP